ncbi:hypothetical protein EA473_07440 [Natrarchaeobius chitinivorans]|uniref:Uncharacterized protein n=1 Tax=Natrarchaeobius chitinivorans TaxID=1679083 RepID=A0A3N6NBH7_NATCH|nr:hypothetical protein EA473_07440 [Natrarchaeobius chitinivorans]
MIGYKSIGHIHERYTVIKDITFGHEDDLKNGTAFGQTVSVIDNRTHTRAGFDGFKFAMLLLSMETGIACFTDP